MGIVEQYLLQMNTSKRRFRRSVALLTALSLLVVMTVFWNLRQTGITIANDACCGREEHQHTEECILAKVLICGFDEEPSSEATTEAPTEAPTEETTEVPTEEATEESPEETKEAMTETSAESDAEDSDETVVTTDPGDISASSSSSSGELETSSEPMNTPHIHGDECYEITYLCELEEHIHDFSCYSDTTADLEDWDIWAASIPELTGQISADIVLVAQSQLGNRESELNFELAEDGEARNGITRYGQWYGNPYGAWSNMFTSFCLRYAGAAAVPVSSGAEKMQLDWEELNLYRHAGGYEPVSGDIVFLDKNQNGTAESTAIVVRYFDFILTVIEGDVDNAVVQHEYRIDDPVISGYGITNPRGNLLMYATADAPKTIGQTATYSNNLLTNGGTFIVYTIGSDGKYYAIDGNGAAVEIQISNNGTITANVEDSSILYWTFTKTNDCYGKPAYYIQNVSTGMYLHPNRDQGLAGSLHTGQWPTPIYGSGNGVKFRGNNQDAYALLEGDKFTYAATENAGSTFYFGKPPAQLTLWLDGTNGNIMSYRGSDNTKYTVYSGVELQLPSQWKSPTKYSYTLAGWINIETGDYYLPGGTITVTKNTVLYADWVATTYDIGQYNADIADTVSTSDFITTHVFDYSSLINLLSTSVSVNATDSSHSETWSHVGSGNVSYKNQTTLNFSFNDHDSSGTITNLNNLNDPNKYTGGTAVYSGIYNENLGEVLFGTNNLFDPETGEGIVGKHYLGKGDYLFQINTDPASEYYGYYYYDAKLNAAAYNQSEQRFYVYNYLARTSDSANNNDEGKYSDFLPLNSPYANTNGQDVQTYQYNGEGGEYAGVAHYNYDARYDSNGSDADYVKANLWFGMRTDVQFGLPDDPGVKLADGTYGNKDIYGNDMHFRFTGDDDVWILVDGNVVLDLGGIHQAAEGDINFSTGEITVNGKSAGKLSGIESGEHILSILYVERGSSMSNCAIYFNLAPRFSLALEKEDVLTREILNGAQFAFYQDPECTQPCELWTSQQAYKDGQPATNLFTIQNGEAHVWGLSPFRAYYIKEVAPPDDPGYIPSQGVIQLILDKNGLSSDGATIREAVDANGNKIPITNGFTIHGFRIDEENQAAYIVITNAQNWVTETTSIYVQKTWNDSEDHTYDAVTVFLNVTDPDGTVRRLREIQLSEENEWEYTWTNLPKFWKDPETGQESDTPVVYTVSEGYVPGYGHTIRVLEDGMYEEVSWAESQSFVNGRYYILKTSQGCLSTVSKTSDTLTFVSEADAKNSSLAIWKATVSNGKVSLENEEGQKLNYYKAGNIRYFNVASGQNQTQNFTAQSHNGGLRLYYSDNKNYYVCGLNNRKYAEAKDKSNSALLFYPMERRNISYEVDIDGYGFSIVNTPLTDETALTVTKKWEHPLDDDTLYEKEQVTFLLLANGVDTNRKETVTLQNNWTVTFSGLPYFDENGEPISYTVVELWENLDWISVMGDVNSSGGSDPTYSTTVINVYRWTNAVVLPATGGIGYPLYILIGMILISAPFVYGFSLRRRYGKGARK